MRILLIRPCPHKDTIGLQSVMICEPLELMSLSAVVKKAGHTVEIVDMILDKRPLTTILDRFSADIVGITAYISHIGVVKNYAKIIKTHNKHTKVYVGGVHATVCPEDFYDDNIDKVLRSDRDFYSELSIGDYEGVFPDRASVDRYKDSYYYLFANHCALIKTSQGCPYSCNFCFCKEISPYIPRDIDSVIAELIEIPQREVYIVDDDFLFNRDRLIDFATRIKELGIEKNFLVYGRADFIAKNEDMIAMLKEVGMSAVIVGLEAAKQEELDRYNKKTDLNDNEKAVKILQKYDIECYGTIILGVDWDKSDFNNLYRYIKKLGLIFVNLQPFTPMKGTEYFNMYKDRLIIPYEEHEKWDMAHLVIKPEKLTLRQYYFQILKLYFKITLPPKHLIYMIKKYGLKTTLKLSKGARVITWQYIKKIIKS